MEKDTSFWNEEYYLTCKHRLILYNSPHDYQEVVKSLVLYLMMDVKTALQIVMFCHLESQIILYGSSDLNLLKQMYIMLKRDGLMLAIETNRIKP